MNSQESIRFRILRSLAALVYRFAWPIVLISALLAAGSVFLAVTKLSYTGNPNDLLKSDAPYHKRYLEYTREFRAEEDYVIVVHGPDFERNKQCVEFIADKLRKQPDLFKNIFYRIDFKELADRGLLFLDLSQLKNIEQDIDQFASMLGKEDLKLDLSTLLSVASVRLDPKNLRKKDNQEGMEDFMDDFVGSLNGLADRLEGKISIKPPHFGSFIQKKSGLAQMEKEAAQNEYLSSENGKILILTIPSPNKEAVFGEHDEMTRPLRGIIGEARAQFPGIEIGLTGDPVLSQDEAEASNRDATRSAIITFILISLLFWFSFREFSRPALAILTLVFAVCWTLGFTTLAVGRLNILSITFIPMILGLGIDFGIQILGRYEEELPKASDVISAITQTMMHTGNAIITGASTIVAAFYTMCLNDFTGLVEMGIIGGTGILFCVIANMVLFPALLSLRDRQLADIKHVPASQQYKKNHLFDRLILDHAWLVIGTATAITLVAVSQIPKIWFDYNLLKMMDPKRESVQFTHLITEGKETRSFIFAASLCQNLKEAEEKTQKFKKPPSVMEVGSITELVPSSQEEKLKVIAHIKHKLERIQLPQSSVRVNIPENVRVLQVLKFNCEHTAQLAKKWASQDQKKEAAEFFGKLIPPMDRALKVLQSMDQKKAEEIFTTYQRQLFSDLRSNLETLKRQKVDRPITENDVPPSVRNQFVGKNGKILVQVYPRENIWDREPLTRFVHDLRSVDPKITGNPIQNYEYIELLKVSYEKAAIYALIAIVILIILHFRHPKYVLSTLLPLGLGIIWTVGLMPLIHLPFNPANIITLPLVIGIGVAFGVYTVDRYREKYSPSIFSTSTGKAILLSAFTTLFGFGSLAFASHKGISSLGLLMSIGVFMCLVTSLYVCPAILHVIGRRRMQPSTEHK